ncbi:MAG: type VI secretion system baseplate subunit TssK [Planctomycetaceae bacterium]
MAEHELHWGEGLFLRPHHFQASDRRLRASIQVSEDWLNGYAYGTRRVEIDEDALLNWRVSLTSCQIRLHDGTHLRFPEDASLDPLSIPRNAFSSEQSRAMVYIAIPRLQRGHRNSDPEGTPGRARYSVQSIEVEDENDGGNAQHIDFRTCNARLIIGEEQAAGFDALPIMRLRLGTTAEAPPEIDPDYVPPLLSCDAWPWLQGFLTRIYDRLNGTADRLASQMVDRGVAFESGHREDLERILQLHAINTALGGVSHLPFVRGVHPLTAYTELCRVVGGLAIFARKRGFPAIPQYNHDDLGTVFRGLGKLLNLGEEPKKGYVKRQFVGAGLQMQVRLDREWLEPSWAFYIGVESRLKSSEVEQLLGEQKLDMKVGSADEVDTIYRYARQGAKLSRISDPPRDFPQARWTFWRIDRTSDAWSKVEDTLGLGIRFNDKQVEGEIDGQHRVEIYNAEDRDLVGLGFALFAIQSN